LHHPESARIMDYNFEGTDERPTWRSDSAKRGIPPFEM
jgi:hypothetical protein